MESSEYLPEPAKPFSQRVAEVASKAGSAAAGTGAGLLTGNPFVGIAAGLSAEQVGKGLTDRLLQRPEERGARTMRVARERIAERQESGEELRSDNFVTDEEGAEELIEAALRASWSAVEQRKSDLIGRTIASASFDAAISQADLMQCLRLLEALSWRQVLALAWIANDDWNEQRQLLGAEGSEGSRQLRPGFEAELNDLADTHGLIGFAQEGGAVVKPVGTLNGGGVTASSFARVTETGLGATLLRLSETSLVIDAAEIAAFVEHEIEV
jgi:hypothetical protein